LDNHALDAEEDQFWTIKFILKSKKKKLRNFFNNPDIVVMNTPGQNANAVAELAFGMMVTNARNHYDGSSGYELKVRSYNVYERKSNVKKQNRCGN
jgi:lactate dehydrogenase-like 2-hydroxyacid dehydrogenase